jgi:hypothetical protein
MIRGHHECGCRVWVILIAATCVFAQPPAAPIGFLRVVASAVHAAGQNGPEAEALRDRAGQYWKRRQAKDLTGAYPFYCATYRSRVSQPQFLQMTRLVRFDLHDVAVRAVAIEGTRASVRVTYKFLLPTLADTLVDGEISEYWVREASGEWCKEDEPLILPFPPPSQAPGAADSDRRLKP